jgi:hypothetical protein
MLSPEERVRVYKNVDYHGVTAIGYHIGYLDEDGKVKKDIYIHPASVERIEVEE